MPSGVSSRHGHGVPSGAAIKVSGRLMMHRMSTHELLGTPSHFWTRGNFCPSQALSDTLHMVNKIRLVSPSLRLCTPDWSVNAPPFGTLTRAAGQIHIHARCGWGRTRGGPTGVRASCHGIGCPMQCAAIETGGHWMESFEHAAHRAGHGNRRTHRETSSHYRLLACTMS